LINIVKKQKLYQFHGCFWHGCPKCFQPDTINNKKQKTVSTLYNDTIKNSDKINKYYKLVKIWECDFNKSKEIKKFEKNWNREVITSLNLRDAFLVEELMQLN